MADREKIKSEFMAVKKAQQKAKNKPKKPLTTGQKKFLAKKREIEISRIQDLMEKEERKRPGPPMKKAAADKQEKEIREIRAGTMKDTTPGLGNLSMKKNTPSSVKKERETDLQRLERIKKAQAQEDAIRKAGKKVGPNGVRLGGEFKGVRKNVLKRIKRGGTIKKMNMGGVMKGRGGTFKGSF